MEDDLIKSLLAGGETKHVDFKGPMMWDPRNDKRGCHALVKDVLAMANTTGGGRLLIGVSDDHRPVGLSQEQMKTWDTTKINHFVNRYADPPINSAMLKRTYEGKQFVVIDVPAFPNLPHVCKSEDGNDLIKTAFYIRTDDNASAVIVSASDLNAIVERAVRNRSDQLLQQIRSVLVGADVRQEPSAHHRFTEQLGVDTTVFDEAYPSEADARIGYLQVAMWPALFDAERFSLTQLWSAAEATNFGYRDWLGLLWPGYQDKPVAKQEAIEVATSLAGANGGSYFWRFHQTGLFFHRHVMLEDIEKNQRWERFEPGQYLEIGELVAFVGTSIDTAAELYSALGVTDEEITLRFDLVGTQDRALWARPPRMLFGGDMTAQIPTIQVQATKALEEWMSGRVDLTLELSAELMRRFNWMTPRIPREDVEKIFSERSARGG